MSDMPSGPARKTILAFGETLWDVFPTGAKLGGAPFNFAYRANSLGDRALVASRLGTDELGERARDEIASLGIDAGLVQRDAERPTGTVPVTVDAKGDPSFVITPDVAYDRIEFTDDLARAAREADCVCFGTLIQRSPASRGTLGRVLDEAGPSPRRSGFGRAGGGAMKLLDINLRKDCHTPDTIVSSLERADVLKLNDDEARHLAALFGMGEPSVPEFAEGVIERWRLTHCVVTLGERGAYAASADGGKAYVPGYRADLADTCGSGDAFTAGFVHRLLRGAALAECCELGNALGAMVASQEGATGRIAPGDIDEFVSSGRERIVDPELASG